MKATELLRGRVFFSIMRLFISIKHNQKTPIFAFGQGSSLKAWYNIWQSSVFYLSSAVLGCFGTSVFQVVFLHSQKTNLPTVLNPPPPPPPVGPQLPGGSLSSNPLGRKEQEAEAAWSACVRALSSCSWNERVKTIKKKIIPTHNLMLLKWLLEQHH